MDTSFFTTVAAISRSETHPTSAAHFAASSPPTVDVGASMTDSCTPIIAPSPQHSHHDVLAYDPQNDRSLHPELSGFEHLHYQYQYHNHTSELGHPFLYGYPQDYSKPMEYNAPNSALDFIAFMHESHSSPSSTVTAENSSPSSSGDQSFISTPEHSFRVELPTESSGNPGGHEQQPWNIVPSGVPFPLNTQEHPSGTASVFDGTSHFARSPSPAKKPRTDQACEKCRARKAKCNGERPTCQRCASRGFVCEYAKERRMRGPNKIRKNLPPPPLPSSIAKKLDKPYKARTSPKGSPKGVKSRTSVSPQIHHAGERNQVLPTMGLGLDLGERDVQMPEVAVQNMESVGNQGVGQVQPIPFNPSDLLYNIPMGDDEAEDYYSRIRVPQITQGQMALSPPHFPQNTAQAQLRYTASMPQLPLLPQHADPTFQYTVEDATRKTSLDSAVVDSRLYGTPSHHAIAAMHAQQQAQNSASGVHHGLWDVPVGYQFDTSSNHSSGTRTSFTHLPPTPPASVHSRLPTSIDPALTAGSTEFRGFGEMHSHLGQFNSWMEAGGFHLNGQQQQQLGGSMAGFHHAGQQIKVEAAKM